MSIFAGVSSIGSAQKDGWRGGWRVVLGGGKGEGHGGEGVEGWRVGHLECSQLLVWCGWVMAKR